MGEPLGDIVWHGARLELHYERQLRHAPEVVWRALTESDQLRHWMPGDIVGERRAGASISVQFWPAHVERFRIPEDQTSLPGEIRAWDPPRLFEWTWDVDVLRWELIPEQGGTLLLFTTTLGSTDEGDSKYEPSSVAAGYHACLNQLAELLDTGTVRVPIVDISVSELEAAYAKVVPKQA